MKVVINRCFGGFGLSRAAVKRIAELQGRPCYFFTHARTKDRIILESYVPVVESDEEPFMWFAFDIPNPNETLAYPDGKTWHEMTMDERQAHNALHGAHSFETGRGADRADALLVQVVEELGKAAWGRHAELAVVDIPDGTDYEIDEYDGSEHIAEKHRTWR